ncbi:ras GTPase-activating protein-binding protein 2 isoform X2 [Uranotaenia lowii]|uniref:ras GTPase-activating protein-binding protein 2 isoform X2 n=1 Tax=Uranotaenia lowii TaxID=190385 RepID=UPI00247ABDEA|nr:ras GTPase-activating protein-binding protein 2 isoform X2 [Uranotaenia lowii]
MVMEAQPSPQSVGREFVRQYYTLLNKAPDHLHRFYNNSSSFVHGGLDSKSQEATLVIGQKQIHSQIQQLNFRDCHAKISQVDSQATLGNGVVVQVSGELSNDGQPMRRFTQTFVLAAQSPKKYYVHNDIFRYQDIYSDDEIDENDRSGEEDGPDVDNNAVVNNQNVSANVVASSGAVPALGLQPQAQDQQQQQQQAPQQAQQQQLYYPPGVLNAGPPGMIAGYGQPQQQGQQQQPQQQLNGVHDDLLKTVTTQNSSQLIQASSGHPSVGTVSQQNSVLQQVPNVAPGIPPVNPIQHLNQQVTQPQTPQLQPQQIPQVSIPQQQQPSQTAAISDPEPISSSLNMNELDSVLPSSNDPTPAEASDAHDHHPHHHGQTDVNDSQPTQQNISNEPKTYANLVKSGGSGGPGPLSFASVSSHHHQQQQSQQHQSSHQQQQGYSNVTAGRQSVLSPPPSGGSSLQNTSSGTVNSGGIGGLGGLGSSKYDRGQQQSDLGQGGPMPQRIQNQQRPIRGNGPSSNVGGGSGPGSGGLRQQDSRPSYSRNYDNDDRRQGNSSQFGDNYQLFLGNIPHHATEDDLKVLFSKYGTVVDLRIHSKQGQKLPGVRAPPNYGFITYEDPASVQNCLANTPLYFPENSPDGQKLNVEEKKTRMRGPGETGGRIGSNQMGGNGGSGPRGGPNGPGGPPRGGPGGPPGNINRGGSGQRGLGGIGGGPGSGGGGSGRGGYPRSDRGSISGGGSGGGGGQRSGNGNYHSSNR